MEGDKARPFSPLIFTCSGCTTEADKRFSNRDGFKYGLPVAPEAVTLSAALQNNRMRVWQIIMERLKDQDSEK